jgi:hypothetical protein
MNRLTEEQVLELAPDAASLKSGKDLANPKKWLNFSYNERVLWGEMQGSGKDPYRTQIDLLSTAFKCSCPSRKFPCKHGLGLFLIFAKDASIITKDNEEAVWVKEWMDKRQTKAETAAAPQTEEPDEKTIAKREKDKEKRDNNRLSLVQGGAAELELLLKDLLRAGFIVLPEKGTAFFTKTAARMVDAKATGLANQAKNFTKINFYSGTDWHSQVLEQAAETYLILESFKNIASQTPAVQEDIRSLVGWSLKKSELLEQPNLDEVNDTWLVLGRSSEQEDDLIIQKQWLLGTESKRYALILDFAHKSAPLQTMLVSGTFIQANLVFYPSNMPFRAVIKTQGSQVTDMPLTAKPLEHCAALQADFVEKLSLFPWADELPFFVRQLTIVTHQDAWFLRDTEGYLMPINPKLNVNIILHLLALTGGKPVDMFLLKTQSMVLPLGLILENIYKTIKI